MVVPTIRLTKGCHLSMPNPAQDTVSAVSILTHPKLVGPFMMNWVPTEAVYEERLADLPKNPDKCVWMIHYHGTHIGIISAVGFASKMGIVEVSILILPEYQGKGIGRKALRGVLAYLCRPKSAITHVRSSVRQDNAPSLRLMKRLGFVEWEHGPDLSYATDQGATVGVTQFYRPNLRLKQAA